MKYIFSLLLLVVSSLLRAAAPTWPIQVSSDGRSFTDSASTPVHWLMTCDANHAMIAGVPYGTNGSGYAPYFTSRQAYGFNCTQVMGSTPRYSAVGAAQDGTVPFCNTGHSCGSSTSATQLSQYNIANWNTAYWLEVKQFCTMALAANMVCAVNPLPGQYYDCNTGSGCPFPPASGPMLANQTTANIQAFGAYFGGLIASLPNAMLYMGDDCGTGSVPPTGNLNRCNGGVENTLMNAILAAAPMVVNFEGSYDYSFSNEYSSTFSASSGTHWSNLIYDYYEPYGGALAAFNSTPTSPCFLGESNYEGGNNSGGLASNANAFITRMENWWTVTQGCPGFVYGNESVNHADSGYPASLTSAGAGDVQWVSTVLGPYKWWSLVPDTTLSGGRILTAGYGTNTSTSNLNFYNSTYATNGCISDGTLCVTYTPGASSSRSLTYNLARFANSVVVKWYDPSNGSATAAGTFPTSTGSHTFTTPGTNGDGNQDWVLVLDATSGTGPTTYQLTVNSGSGSGNYPAGQSVPIVANAPASGFVFSNWTTTGGATVASSISASTTLTMPAGTATATANYSSTSANTYTAASCNRSDVNAVINGGVHTAVNGDTILIPAGTCTWTSPVNVSVGITIQGSGTPNTGAASFGAGTLNTIIADNVGSKYTPLISQTGLTYGQTFIVGLLDIEPASTGAQIGPPIEVNGTCTSSGCGMVRIHNIYFGKTTPISSSNGLGTQIIVDNAFGVADHDSTNPNMSGLVEFINPMLTSYLGVGTWGDNSWAQPDTFGTANEFYVENGIIYTGATVTEGEFPIQSNMAIGGGRVVGRFNKVYQNTPGTGAFSYHGLDTGQRSRAGRHIEAYNNTMTCTLSTGCGEAPCNFRGGTGFCWGNQLNGTNGGFWNSMVNANIYRTVAGTAEGWNYCGGNPGDSTGAYGNGNSVFDTNDPTVYVSGTATSVSNGGLTITDSTKSWTTNQWHPGAGTEFSIHDITKGFYTQIGGQTGSNTLNLASPISESGWSGFSAGDSYQIYRPIACADQIGRGQGAYVSGLPPVPAAPVNQALDPVYAWGNTSSTSPVWGYGPGAGLTFNGLATFNRDYYTDNLAGGTSQIQTSPTSPFTGSATAGSNATPGAGFGTLANRPTTCTTGVGYFATDQGSWNISGIGTQGILYTCGAGNMWNVYYTPYTYPHPLAGGASAQLYPLTVNNGSGSGNYISGAVVTITAPCTITGQVFVNWTGFAVANSTGCPTTTLTMPAAPVTVTANYMTAPPSLAVPTFSPGAGSYSSAQTVTISLPAGATVCYTTDGSTPAATAPGTCSHGTTYSVPVTVAASETVSAIATESTWTNSTVGTAAYTITSICAQNQAAGAYTLCGETYAVVTGGPSVSASYSPVAGNGVIVSGWWCYSSGCNTSTPGITASLGDNINAVEPGCFASPHSPYLTNANGGAQGSGDFQEQYIWYCPSIPSGVTSFTVTPSSGALSYLQIHVSEWKTGSLAASCSPLSACFENVDNFSVAGNTTGGTAAAIVTSGPTVSPNDLVYAVIQIPCCSFTSSAGPGYTAITVASSLNPGMAVEAKAVTSTGVQTATSTWTGGQAAWFGMIVPIKAASQPSFTLAVTNGTGGGTFAAGSVNTITANAAPAGQVFFNWTTTGGTLGSSTSQMTTLTMPSSNVTVTANYTPQTVSPIPSVIVKGNVRVSGSVGTN